MRNPRPGAGGRNEAATVVQRGVGRGSPVLLAGHEQADVPGGPYRLAGRAPGLELRRRGPIGVRGAFARRGHDCFAPWS